MRELHFRPLIQLYLYGCDVEEGSKIITDVKCIINGRASDFSSQVIADGGWRDVVGEVVVERDVEDGHPAVYRRSLFTLLLSMYMI